MADDPQGDWGPPTISKPAAISAAGPGIVYPDIQYHFLPLAISYDGKTLAAGHGYQVHVGTKRSKSRAGCG